MIAELEAPTSQILVTKKFYYSAKFPHSKSSIEHTLTHPPESVDPGKLGFVRTVMTHFARSCNLDISHFCELIIDILLQRIHKKQSIIIFGPANTGKSTLIGLLVCTTSGKLALGGHLPLILPIPIFYWLTS